MEKLLREYIAIYDCYCCDPDKIEIRSIDINERCLVLYVKDKDYNDYRTADIPAWSFIQFMFENTNIKAL